MKAIDVIRRSGRNLQHAKIRTLLTAIALAVGGFTLTLTLAAANGAQAYSQKLIDANFDPHSVFVAKDKTLFDTQTNNDKPREYSSDFGSAFGTTIKLLDANDIAKIKQLPHVGDVVRQYNLTAQYITREGAKKVLGAINVYDASQKPEIIAGHAGGKLSAGTAVLPDAYLSQLNFDSPRSAIDQKIIISVAQAGGQTQAFNFKVAAVSTKSKFDIGVGMLGPYVSETDAAAINAFTNKGMASADKVPTVIVRSDTDNVTAESLKQEIESAGYQARTAKDLQSFLDQVIKVLQIIILVFGFITLIASFFGVVNTQYISVLERTREVGLMKALGMRRGTVSWLFIVEATWIGLLGAVLGSVAAVGVGTALNPWISKQINFGNEHLLLFKPLQIAALVIFLMVVTTIAGLLPARKAAKLDPIEALRTE
jgi:putative ABC transport system permease protein